MIVGITDHNIICVQTCKETQDIGALTKAADFVKAFILGFQVEVNIAFTYK